MNQNSAHNLSTEKLSIHREFLPGLTAMKQTSGTHVVKSPSFSKEKVQNSQVYSDLPWAAQWQSAKL